MSLVTPKKRRTAMLQIILSYNEVRNLQGLVERGIQTGITQAYLDSLENILTKLERAEKRAHTKIDDRATAQESE